MTPQEKNKEVAHRWFDEVWNQGLQSTIDELFHADGVAYGFPEPDSVLNHQQFKDVVRQFQGAFSDIHIVADDLIAEDDRLAVRYTARMTHTGDDLGIAATGTRVIFSGGGILHLRDGQILHAWNMVNTHHITQQLQAV